MNRLRLWERWTFRILVVALLVTNTALLAFGWTGYWQIQALVLTVIGLPFVTYVALRLAD